MRKHEQFKSKMKKVSQLHYTPAPMLNPERNGTGLFSTIPSNLLNDFNFDEGDMMDFFEKPRVNIGTDYQATLPSENVEKYDEKKSCETLLWRPNVLDDDRQLDRFIELVKSSAVPMGTHSVESALKVLMESQGEIHVAVLKLLQCTTDNSLEKRWSQIEMEQFLKGLEKHGKNFSNIARDILHKTTGDCVQLYYFWKKLCNEYKSTHLPKTTRQCNFIAYNNNNDDFFDYVDSNGTGNNGHNNHNNSTAAANNNNNIHNSELRPHVCEVPDCSAVS